MIWILLPAYNEELSFPPLTAKIRATMDKMGAAYRVVVVNDGSKDSTSKVLDDVRKVVPLDVSMNTTGR